MGVSSSHWMQLPRRRGSGFGQVGVALGKTLYSTESNTWRGRTAEHCFSTSSSWGIVLQPEGRSRWFIRASLQEAKRKQGRLVRRKWFGKEMMVGSVTRMSEIEVGFWIYFEGRYTDKLVVGDYEKSRISEYPPILIYWWGIMSNQEKWCKLIIFSLSNEK